MTTYNTSIPNGTLGYLLSRMRTYLDWAPDSAPETEARQIHVINDEIQRLAVESPWLVTDAEVEIPLDVDFASSTTLEDDVVQRHEHDPFVLWRLTSDEVDNWPVDGSWNSRWIEITNESGDVERRRIRDVWLKAVSDIPAPTPDYLYMTVDQALTITGETLRFKVMVLEYPLPHGTLGVTRAGLIASNRSQYYDVSQKITPMPQMQTPAFLGGSRATVDGQLMRWYCGSEVQPLLQPMDAPTVAKTTGQGATWTGPDLPGTFEYCVAYAWGQYDIQSTQDESATLRPIPRYLSPPSAASAALSVTAGGHAIQIYLPDVAWLAGWGENTLTTSTSDVRWGHTGIRRYVYRRRTTSAAPSAPPHTNAHMQRHVPADGTWRLWRVVSDETVQTLTDTGALPLAMPDRPLTTDGRHMTIVPDGSIADSSRLYLRLRRRPPPLFGASDPLGLVPGAEIVVALRAAARFAAAQAKFDVERNLLNTAADTVRAMRGASQGVASRVTKRRPPRIE